jgi:hypothetical protein
MKRGVLFLSEFEAEKMDCVVSECMFWAHFSGVVVVMADEWGLLVKRHGESYIF